MDSLNHQVELRVVIGSDCKNVSEGEALDYILGYVLALDMTLNVDDSHSMLLIKGFDTSCPVSGFIARERIANPDDVNLQLSVNGEVRQKSNTIELIASVPQIISYLSKYFKLEYGDLILSRTPPGIAQVRGCDVIEASLGELMNIRSYEVVQE